jgi:predicted ATPase
LLAFEALLRDLGGSPLLLALSAEPHPPREELDQLSSRATRDLTAAVVSLAPLPAAAIRELVRVALPRYSDWDAERVARRVQIDSAGLPLLVVELLHGVALGMDLQGLELAWPEPMRTLSQTLPGGLPEAVVGAIRVGFRRLSAEGQQVLTTAAVLGERLPAELLARASQLPLAAVHRELDALEWQRWLSADARGYSFVARVAREVVARDMVTKGQRQRILSLAEEPGPGAGEAPTSAPAG